MVTRYSDDLPVAGPADVAVDCYSGPLAIWERNRKRRRDMGSGALLTVWLIVALVLGLVLGSVEGSHSYDGNNGSNTVGEDGNTKSGSDLDSGSGSTLGDADAAVGTVASVTAISTVSATATVTVTVSDAGASTMGTCFRQSEKSIAGLGGIPLFLHGQEQCLVGSEKLYSDSVFSLSSVPSFSLPLSVVGPSADTTVSSSQEAQSHAIHYPDSSDSLLDASLFLSFEEWKKRNLEKAGQSPDHIGSSGRRGAGGVGSKKGGVGSAAGPATGGKRPENNIDNALDALGDDVEIEWGGFSGNDVTRVEDGKESISKHMGRGSGERRGTTDVQGGNSDQHGDEGSGDTAAQDRAAAAPLAGTSTRSSSSREAGKTCKERFNYASFDCGATILKTNTEGKSPSAVLVEHKDSYMLNECGAKETKFLIVELCADILVDTVVLANYEFFSSMFRTFRVSVSDRYPPPSSSSVTPQRNDDKKAKSVGRSGGDDNTLSEGKNDSEKGILNSGKKDEDTEGKTGKSKSDGWRELGIFEARNSRGIQAFAIENPLVWARYLRVEFLSHYGNEFYCPVSLLRVHGTTMMEEFKYQQEEAESENETEIEIAENEEADNEIIEGSTPDRVEVELDAKSSAIDATAQETVKADSLLGNTVSEGIAIEGKQKDSQEVVSSSDGPGSSSVGPYSTSSFIEPTSVNPSQQQQQQQQQQQPALQDVVNTQLDTNDASALATIYSNLTIDQLLGMVNEHFKYVGRNGSDGSDETIVDAASTAPDGGNVIDETATATSVSLVANTISTNVATGTSKDLSNAASAINDATETLNTDSKTDTALDNDDQPATQAIYENGSIVSSSTSITSTNCYTHKSPTHQATTHDKPETSITSPSVDLSQSPSTSSTIPVTYASSESTLSSSSSSSSSSSPHSSSSSSTPSHSPSIALTSSSSTRPPTPNPTTQESFFKTVHKRLQRLESNSTLSLQYIEDQSRILRDAFLKVEKRQSIKIDEYLAKLSENITEEIGHYRDQHDQLWHMISLELSTYRQEHQREIIALSSRLSILADELVFQQRVSIAQSVLLVLCLGILLFGSAGRGYVAADFSGAAGLSYGGSVTSTSVQNIDIPLLQQTLARSQRALRKWVTGYIHRRSNSVKITVKNNSICNDIGSDSGFLNGSDNVKTNCFGDSGPKKDGREESSSDLSTGTYTPSSASVTDTHTDHVREVSPSGGAQFRFNEQIFSNSNNGNKENTRNQDKGHGLRLNPLQGNRIEQELLSPLTSSPFLSPSSATVLLDELRETQSGPPTPSGRRSIS